MTDLTLILILLAALGAGMIIGLIIVGSRINGPDEGDLWYIDLIDHDRRRP